MLEITDGHFHRGLGLRIDLALVSESLARRLRHCGIERNYRKGKKPSDHAPLAVDLASTLEMTDPVPRGGAGTGRVPKVGVAHARRCSCDRWPQTATPTVAYAAQRCTIDGCPHTTTPTVAYASR